MSSGVREWVGSSEGPLAISFGGERERGERRMTDKRGTDKESGRGRDIKRGTERDRQREKGETE